MKKLLFLGQGRLGNQMFQWVAINKVFPDATILAPSMAALMQVIDTKARLQIKFNNELLRLLASRKGGRAIVRLAYHLLRPYGYAYEPLHSLHGGIKEPSGQMKIVRAESSHIFVDGGYYQNLRTFLQPRDFQDMQLRSELLERTNTALRSSIGAGHWPDFVVHVRRTDYLNYHPFGLSDVTLRAHYFLKAAAHMREQLGSGARALVITDDPAWCREAFRDMGAFHIFSDRQDVDFAALTQFPGIVIANSSFSLAAACISRLATTIVAPRYWFGANVETWYPAQIESTDPRFIYI